MQHMEFEVASPPRACLSPCSRYRGRIWVHWSSGLSARWRGKV